MCCSLYMVVSRLVRLYSLNALSPGLPYPYVEILVPEGDDIRR